MTSLSRRLQKLEAVVEQNRGFNIMDGYETALAQLTASDRELVNDLMDRRASIQEEGYRAALNRFEAAYAEVAKELRSPVLLTGADFLL